MISFIDGPAQNLTLSLARAPRFLRVVHGAKWDALDQIGDEPASSETLYAYECATPADQIGSCFWDGRDPKTGRRTGGCSRIAEYRYVPNQPTDAQMRDQTHWEMWCEQQVKEVQS